MRRDTAYTAIMHLTALLSLAACNSDVPSDRERDGDSVDILLPTRTDEGKGLAAGTTFRAVAFYSSNGAFADTGTYFIKNDGDNILTPAEITYNDNENTISAKENREKALHNYHTNVDVYLVSPACKINGNDGCLAVDPQEPLYVSSKKNFDRLMHYAPLDFSGEILKTLRSRLIINFYQLSEFSTSAKATIKDVELNNAGTSNEVLYHMPTQRVVTDANHKVRSITLTAPENATEITADGKTFKHTATTGEIYVVSATYNPHVLTSSLSSDYIYLDFTVSQNGGELPQSLLLTDNLFETLEPGYEYSYRVLLSSEILQLTLVVSPWNELAPASTDINNGFTEEYNLGSWTINGWGAGTSGDSGTGSITNPQN